MTRTHRRLVWLALWMLGLVTVVFGVLLIPPQARGSDYIQPAEPLTSQNSVAATGQLTASKVVTFAPGGDRNSNGLVDAGDVLRYIVTTSNISGATVSGVNISDTLEANTTLSGTVRVSPVAVDDAFTVMLGTLDTSNVVTVNDSLGRPSAAVVAYANVDDLGGPSEVSAGTPYVVPTSGGVAVIIDASGTITIDATAGTVNEGSYSFDYQLSNALGDSAGRVSFEVVVDAPPVLTTAQVEENDPADSFILLPEQGSAPAPTVTDNPDLRLAFNEPVTVTTASYSLTCTTSGDVSAAYSLSATPATTVTLSYGGSGLSAGETCTLNLDSAAISDSFGNPLDGNGNGAIDGAADDLSFVFVVDTPPTLTAVEAEISDTFTAIAGTFPNNGLHNVDADTQLRLTFDEAVTDTGGLNLTCDDSGSLATDGGGLSVAGNGSSQLVVSRNSGQYTAGETCTLSLTEANLTDSDQADTPDNLLTPNPSTYQFEIALSAFDDAFTVTAHLEARFDTVAPGTSNLFSNDNVGSSPIVAVNGSSANVDTEITLPSNAYLSVEADGDFNYTPPPGAQNGATDSFTYTVETIRGSVVSATATITINGDLIWYVDLDDSNGGPYEGTAAHPFANLTGSNSFEANVSDTTNQTIFIYDSASDNSAGQCGLTLLNGQVVIGEGEAADTLNTLTGRNPVAETVFAPDTTGNAPQLTSAGHCFTLGQNNTLRGFAVGNTTGGSAFVDGGATVGTLSIANVAVTGSGGIVQVSNGGTLDVAFTETSSSGSPGEKIELVNVNGSLSSSAGILNHSTAGADAVLISGGSVSATLSSSFNQTGGNALIRVNGGHTGNVTFNNTLDATAGDGLQFDNADGTYSFNNQLSVSGTTAGVNIQNGSDGTLSMTNTNSGLIGINGIPFRLNNSVMDVTYNGQIEQRSGALLSARVVEIITGTGSIAFNGEVIAGDNANFNTAEIIYLENTGTANVISFGYVDATSRDTAVLISRTSGNLSIDRLRFRCDGDLSLGGDTHCLDISDTTSSGVTVEAIAVALYDSGEYGGAISLVNTPGTWTVEDFSGGLSGQDEVMVYGSNFGTLNIGTVDDPNTDGTLDLGAINVNNRAALDLTNGTVNIEATIVNSYEFVDHGINLVNVAGPLFQLTGDITLNADNTGTENENIYLENVTVTTINFGTDGSTHNTVALNDRQSYGVTVTSTTTPTPDVNFGNLNIPNPNSVPEGQINQLGYGGTVNYISLVP